MTERTSSVDPASRRPGRNALWHGLLVVICAVVVLLCAGEILLRSIDFTEHKVPTGKAAGTHVFDPVLGWSLKPNADTTSTTTNRTISVKQNSIGLRERELNEVPPDRFLFVGDSFTWGYDAELHERFTTLLQNALPQYGMVNAGVSGFGTDQQMLQMNRLWNLVRPKVVVLTFCVDNDRDDNSSSLRYRRQHKPYFVRMPDGQLQVRGYPLPQLHQENRARGPWSERLMLVRFALDMQARLREREVIVPDPTERLIDTIQRTAQSRGAWLVVGLQRHQPKLEAHLRLRSIPYTTFDEAPGYPTAGWHWTPEGNAIVARKYLAVFTELGMVPGPLPAPPAASADLEERPIASHAPGVWSPALWRAAGEALPRELAELGDFLKFWVAAVRDARGTSRVLTALGVLTALSLALLMFVVWWRLRVRGASGEYSRFSKALRSFGAFLGWALLGPLAVVTLLEASEVRMLELSYGLVAGLLIGEFGRAVAVAVLAPDDPPRRLLAVDDGTARSLSRHLTWGARGLGVLVWAQAIHRALAAPPVLSVATDTVFSLFVAALVLHLLWAQRRIATAPTPKPLRALAWLCVAAIAIAIVAGYPSGASFIAARLVSIVAVLGLLYLLWILGRELFATRLSVGSPHSVTIAADFGVGMRGLGVAAVLTGLSMVLAALSAVFVIYIGPW